MKNTRPVSLICTVYNEANSVKDFMESLANNSVLPSEFIIVDGGSHDGTPDIIKEYLVSSVVLNVRLIVSSKRINIAEGRNIAVKEATTEIIVVTDAGCRLGEYWLEEISKPFFEYGEVDVVSGWYEPLSGTSFQNKIASATIPNLDDIDTDTFLPSSRSIAFRKSCWEKVGGYPEHLRLCGEDTLFDLRLKNVGCNFVFNPKAVVYWEMRDNLTDLLRQYYMYGFGEGEAGIFVKKYLARIAILFMPILAVFTSKKLKHFGLRYLIYWALVLGWIKGSSRKKIISWH